MFTPESQEEAGQISAAHLATIMRQLSCQEFDATIDQPPEYVKRVEKKKTIREAKKKAFLEKARKIFDDADTDNSSFLSMEQSRALALKMHKEHGTEFNEEEFQEYFKATDLNSDGKLSWEEWSKNAMEQAREGGYFDSDDEEYDAYIDLPPFYVKRIERKKTIREEKKKAFLEKARKIFDAADTDNSGFLSMG